MEHCFFARSLFKDGVSQVTDRLLPHVKELLSPRGLFYLVVLPENKPG